MLGFLQGEFNRGNFRMIVETLDQLADQMDAGNTTARDLTEACLARIENEKGEGGRAFLMVDAEGAIEQADYMDGLRRKGRAPSRYAGIPVSLKDLFDVAGQVTAAGSTILRDAEPASRDATCVGRLRAAGFVFLGRTNMTEFAYSGVGLNPHYGTPKSVWDRASGRIPGGSSSGAGVSVADGMAYMGLGTDTGGSCRIPAAFNGIVGYKSSTGRVPKDGVFPLSATLDTVGPLANSAACCSTIDAIMAGDRGYGAVSAREPHTLRFGILQHVALDAMAPEVATAFDATIKTLGKAGVAFTEVAFTDLLELPNINSKGGISACEAMDVHAAMIERHGDEYDQRVRRRIESGLTVTGPELVGIYRRRREMMAKFARLASGLDGFVMPTVPILPPLVSDVDDDQRYGPLNFLCLRNTFLGNFLDSCAISLPMTARGEAPAGLMIMRPHGEDTELFNASAGVEAVLRETLA
jgi:aspartyl-tRNA(Asn)/glutamyl-tRNA(Gln) amidotransferase subunit A